MKRIFALFFAFALALPAFAAITIVQHHASWQGANVGLTVSCPLTSTGAGRNIIVGAGYSGFYWTYNNGTVVVSSVTDDRGNIYSLAPGSRATTTSHFAGTEVWSSLNATAGVTSVSITFRTGDFQGPMPEVYRPPGAIFCISYELSGAGLSFDAAANVGTDDGGNGMCVTFTCSGPGVTTSTSSGFLIGVISIEDWIDQNPLTGNEFISGGDVANAYGGINPLPWAAACSLLSSTAAAHQPSWHRTRWGGGGTSPVLYAASSAAFKQ